MSSSVPGLVLRPGSSADVPALRTLINRAHEHDRIPQIVEEDELAEELELVDLAEDVRIAEVDGAIVGYCTSWFAPSSDDLQRVVLFGEVDPDHRRRGIGRELLSFGIARGRVQLATTDAGRRRVIRADAYEQVTDAHRLFARLGFTAVRWFEELLRPLAPIPEVTFDPAYDIVPWPSGRDDELCDVRNEAFRDHWGSVGWTIERFREATTRFGVRLDLSLAAIERSSGAIVGVCINEHYPQDAELIGRRDGWVAILGTRAAHRRRGLAGAMLVESLRRFRDAGFTNASIGVDSESPTGANRLYRSLGFEPEQRRRAYEIVAG